MKNRYATALIGGYDLIAKDIFSEVKLLNNKSIFININSDKVKKNSVFNFEIFELRKILTTLKKNKIKNLLFIGKINRPNLSNFKSDGEIDKYIPTLINSYKKGDGHLLLAVLEIFIQKGFRILSPRNISKSFFLTNDELSKKVLKINKLDITKSINILNDLSKYDNAQSIVTSNGYILGIEAAEGTDDLLKRVAIIRKRLGQSEKKIGVLTKIPKKNQSKLVDLPVVGVSTLKLIRRANLSGIAINPKLTIIHSKTDFLRFAKKNDLKIYSIYN